jgi:hypothetical protein
MHDILQLEPLHTYGAHSVGVPSGAWSVCIPSHEAPARAMHVFDAVSHANIAAQSASLVHDVKHPVPVRHAYSPHATDISFSQCPAPSHAAPLAWSVLHTKPPPHDVPCA